MWSRSFILVLCLLILYDIHFHMTFPLTVRLLENAVCNQYYQSLKGFEGPISESQCKIVPIQTRLAYIRGWYGFFRTLPALAFGLYFGGLADRKGRRPAYVLILTGSLIQLIALYTVCHYWTIFKIELAWVAALLFIIGGGQVFAIGLGLAMVSDLSKSEEKSRLLYTAFAAKYTAELLAPQIAASTLEHSLWLCALVTGLTLVLAYPILFFLPETLDEASRARSHLEEDRSLLSKLNTLKNLVTDSRIARCMLLTFLTQFRYINESILVPYASVRFSWTIAQVYRLLSVLPAISLILFIILPPTTRWLQLHFHMSEKQQTHLLLKCLIAALIAGDILIILAPTIKFLVAALAVFALGNGTRAPILSITSSYIRPDQHQITARLYTLLSITDAFAHMVGDPLLQTVWKRALEIGGKWLVLPFIVTSGCFGVALIVSFTLPRTKDVVRVEGGGDQGDESNPLVPKP